MKNWKAVFLTFLFMTASGSALARPGLGGGGGEIPSPFEAANQKVELADGETYFLVGRVVLQPAVYGGDKYKPTFEVDFEAHPWLATTHRKLNPYYVLDGSISYWKQFRGMKIKLACQARGVVQFSSPGKPEYSIMLKRMTDNPVEPFYY